MCVFVPLCVFGGIAELEVKNLEVVSKLKSKGVDEVEVSRARVGLVRMLFCMWLLYPVEPERNPIRVPLFT
jgi:hypothetical protein